MKRLIKESNFIPMKFPGNKRFAALIFFIIFISWKPAGNTEVRRVDLAFCIDLSASTNGILNDVRNRMWSIANGILQKNEQTELRIAVVGYGRPSFGSGDGYVKILSELSNEFDRSSYNLFQLKARIEKGDQFVPEALFETFRKLKWRTEATSEKMVFLIGNGSVYTGSINLADLCEEYKKNDIRINTVFVSQSKRVFSQLAGYRRIATETGGKFYIMDASSRQVINKAPQIPQKVLSLNDSLNKTFMFYSKDAEERNKFFRETDKNVMRSGNEYFYSRLYYKTSRHYVEGYEPYDLTSYILKYDKMPERINLDFLGSSEKTLNISEIEKRARTKASDRLRLNEEIKDMFSTMGKISADTLLDGFVLGSYR